MNQSIAENLAITVEDYLEGEPLADMRHEYIEGHVYATGNMFALLKSHLRGSGSRIYIADMKLMVDDRSSFFNINIGSCYY